jgi:hypothetical protein
LDYAVLCSGAGEVDFSIGVAELAQSCCTLSVGVNENVMEHTCSTFKFIDELKTKALTM